MFSLAHKKYEAGKTLVFQAFVPFPVLPPDFFLHRFQVDTIRQERVHSIIVSLVVLNNGHNDLPYLDKEEIGSSFHQKCLF